jgi:heme/copper-type cytochrome/quinol oxidase subunit 2
MENNNGKKIVLTGFSLLILAVILAPPISIVIFFMAAVMIIGGGRKHKKFKAKGIPLSQKSAKSMLLTVVPAAIILVIALIFDRYSGLLLGVAICLFAYSIAGIIETYIDKKLPHAKARWESMHSLKKLIISILVIAFTIAIVSILIPILA